MIQDATLHHAGISVADLQRSIAFYRDQFGFELDSHAVIREGFEIAHLRKGNDYLELFWLAEHLPLPDSAGALDTDLRIIGTKHLAFATEDAHAAHTTLKEAGVQVESEVLVGSTGYDYFFLKDPDGILVEIVRKRPQQSG